LSDDAPWTIRSVLRWTTSFFAEKGIEGPRFDAELLICDALSIDRLTLFTDSLRPLTAEELAGIRARVRRRATREPVAYIVGRQGFHALDLKVDRRVLVPRPETELLVERALLHLTDRAAPTLVDVGTGSGAVALALAHARPDARVIAVDRSPDALDVAAHNRETLGLLSVELRHGDLLGPVDERALDLVVSNPPYIPTADLASLPLDVRGHEPRMALDGGPDGLVLVRRLIAQAAEALAEGGWLLFEIGFDQGESAPAAVAAHGGFEAIALHRDLAGLPRVVEARRSRR
jgi:release factor glutamine methyltransferase